ncbi:P-loop ATPase, Sll1717 family [Bradyrhizobium ottawaense]|uniref:P-loop ATPase, Sll1717 family n=1 Tax=Bradyrhizobium ottawaense TaxID=931866 RepID=UPI003519D5CA
MIGITVDELCNRIADKKKIAFTPWPALQVQGLKIDKLIRERIREADFVAADITYPNFNVYYEIGYCIGSRKPFFVTVNTSFESAAHNASLTGFFDTWGQVRYHNASELWEQLAEASMELMTSRYIKPRNHSQPLYVLDTLAKTDFRNFIFQSIANTSLEARTFDPDEAPRFPLHLAIGEVTSSAGVVLPLISSEILDHLKHNLRAALLAGMAHGFELEPLIVQFDDKPAPLDFRDFMETTRGRKEVEDAVESYCQQTLIRNQSPGLPRGFQRRSPIEKIDLGASNAENEQDRLESYFVETAQYAKAQRAQGAVVVGRKGSGKSAIFLRMAAEKAADVRNLVVELNPSSHHLSELRESLLGVVAAGVFDHTIAAFWQYILYAEILLKLREKVLPKARYSLKLLQEIQKIEKQFGLTEEMVASDFTARLEIVVRKLVSAIGTSKDTSRERLTNLLFEGEIAQIRESIVRLAADFDSVTVLFDNIDKGWPTGGLEKADIRTIRHLIERLSRIQHELAREEIYFQHVVFLRSDVYDELVEETSDRGKYNPIRIDWTDALQLEHLIRRRIQNSVEAADEEPAWVAFNTRMPNGQTALESMIANCLMRPRFLIDLCENALSFAINRGHQSLTENDVTEALEQHSLYLVSYFGYEVRDISGLDERIFFGFLGQGQLQTEEQIKAVVLRVAPQAPTEKVIRLLLWYGFLGIPGGDGEAIYIYDRQYDIKRLEAERSNGGGDPHFVINPAFLRGLNSSNGKA